jgi:hypothetical protein
MRSAIPRLSCNQPDLSVNKSVAEVHENAGAIVSQYTYDDVIEAYVVSTDEFGNFHLFSNIATATTAAMGLVFLWMQRIPISILDLEIKCT